MKIICAHTTDGVDKTTTFPFSTWFECIILQCGSVYVRATIGQTESWSLALCLHRDVEMTGGKPSSQHHRPATSW